MSELVTIDQLNDKAKSKAISDFALFYYKLYRNNNLEILNSYDNTGIILDLNRDMFMHKYNQESTIVKDSIHDRSIEYSKLIQKLGQKFFDNGNPEKSWEDWYHDQFNSARKGL